MKLRPPEKHVIVKMESGQDKTKGGLHIPATVMSLGPRRGIVVGVGKDADFTLDDTVLFLPNSGIGFTHDGVEYIRLPNVGVLAALEE